MQIVSKFEKICYENYFKDIQTEWEKAEYNYPYDGKVESIYNDIIIPKRATKGSAGYDFYSPFSFDVSPGDAITIPTGIKCKMINDWVLMLFPRSGLGFKYKVRLNNTVGIIDSDYYNNSDNEGHIMVCLYNDSDEDIKLKKNERIVQGIFQKFYLTDNDNVSNIRMGGIGSTNQKGDDNYE